MRWFWILTLCSLPMLAQGPKGTGIKLIERLNQMSPGERQKMLNRMPADRRRVLEERIDHLNRIAPEARETLKKDYESFQQLPPEKQDAVRKTLKQIAELPDERRPAVRSAINTLRQQPVDLRGRKMASRAFQQSFNEDERKLIKEALNTLPPADASSSPED